MPFHYTEAPTTPLTNDALDPDRRDHRAQSMRRQGGPAVGSTTLLGTGHARREGVVPGPRTLSYEAGGARLQVASKRSEPSLDSRR